MKPVTIYTTDYCPLCTGAKALLTKRGIDYREINFARDPDGRSELVRLTGRATFPQVLVGEQVIGGFAELVAADRAGQLTELLAA